MLPSVLLRFVGVCLLVIGIYDSNVYWYALRHGEETFNFFGRNLRANHTIVRAAFAVVLAFLKALCTSLLVASSIRRILAIKAQPSLSIDQKHKPNRKVER